MFVPVPNVPMSIPLRPGSGRPGELAMKVSSFGYPPQPVFAASPATAPTPLPRLPWDNSGEAILQLRSVSGGAAKPAVSQRAPLPGKAFAGLAPEMTPKGELVSSVLMEVLGKDLLKCNSVCAAESRWWTRSRLPLLCPLTGFPISMLPYPPFKLRLDPRKPSPHKLVDGKYLAMQLIVNHHVTACGRVLQPSDIKALDEYVHRCKLGPFRPGRVAALLKEAASPDEHSYAVQELERFRNAARTEMGKLRRIQESRLLQLGLGQQALPGPGPEAGAGGGAGAAGGGRGADAAAWPL